MLQIQVRLQMLFSAVMLLIGVSVFLVYFDKPILNVLFPTADSGMRVVVLSLSDCVQEMLKGRMFAQFFVDGDWPVNDPFGYVLLLLLQYTLWATCFRFVWYKVRAVGTAPWKTYVGIVMETMFVFLWLPIATSIRVSQIFVIVFLLVMMAPIVLDVMLVIFLPPVAAVEQQNKRFFASLETKPRPIQQQPAQEEKQREEVQETEEVQEEEQKEQEEGQKEQEEEEKEQEEEEQQQEQKQEKEEKQEPTETATIRHRRIGTRSQTK